MRLIDAEPMIKVLEKEKASDDCNGLWYSTVCSMLKLIVEAVVEVKEQKRGKWIDCKEITKIGYECSECGEYCGAVEFIPECDFMSPIWNFCPNCGTQMHDYITCKTTSNDEEATTQG